MDEVTTTAAYDAAVNYIREGYAIIPVEGLKSLDGQECLCGKYPCGLDNKHAGKHPASGRTGWQLGPAMSLTDAYAIFVEECPDYNLGARTGDASGFFALDVEAEGLAELAELEAIHGPLPRTRTHRTGGGGKHKLFKMPDFEVRNNQKKLSPCIDIRGTGGMIVLPPSVSGKGMYAIEDDAPIAEAPGWLLDWLRARLRADFDPGELTVVEDLPAYSDLEPARQEQCQRYAQAVIEREAAAYATAPPGTGNGALFDSACNILEIVQSPWNLFTLDDAVKYLEAGRQRRLLTRPGGGQGVEEFRKTFRSAQGKVIGKGRPLPPDPREALMFDFPPSPPGSSQPPGSDTAADDDPFMNPDGTYANGADAPPPPTDPVEALLAKMLTRDDLDNIPAPKSLIRDMLFLDSESWIIGAPGGFKSFVALDWAMHVGRGMGWRGKRVTQGEVVYIVAEGAKGIPLRVRAWEEMYGQRMEGVRFLPEPIQVSDELGWAVLVAACRRIKPVMIVIDTQARVTVGLEENSARDMGVLIDAVRKLRAATGACVLVVHHTGRNGGDARGSSALDGAQDTEIKVERPEVREERAMLTATIRTDKQKDGDETAEFDIQLQVVEVGVDEDGELLTSLAIKPHDPFAEPPKRPEPVYLANLVPNQANLLDALREHADHPVGATGAELRAFLKERGIEIDRGSAGTALTALLKKELIFQKGAKYVLPEYAPQEVPLVEEKPKRRKR